MPVLTLTDLTTLRFSRVLAVLRGSRRFAQEDSLEFRQPICGYVARGHPARVAGRVFGVSEPRRLCGLQRSNGRGAR